MNTTEITDDFVAAFREDADFTGPNARHTLLSLPHGVDPCDPRVEAIQARVAQNAENDEDNLLGAYKNLDPRCEYPWNPSPVGLIDLGYCFDYARHVNGVSGYEDLEKICADCECCTK